MLRKPLLTLGLMALSFPAALRALEHSLRVSPGEVAHQQSSAGASVCHASFRGRLVEVEVVVRDSRGKSVKGLTRDDFELRDSGKRRDLTAFSVAGTDLAFEPASYEQLADCGITGSLSLEALPGAYSLRAVIQEGVPGKIRAETRKIRID
jgi:hypothetical protein